MSLTLPDVQPLDLAQLTREVAALGLRDFTGCSRLSRDSDGNRIPFYILVKIGVLTAPQETLVSTTVANHVPITPIPTRQDILVGKLADDTITDAEHRELHRLKLGL